MMMMNCGGETCSSSCASSSPSFGLFDQTETLGTVAEREKENMVEMEESVVNELN